MPNIDYNLIVGLLTVLYLSGCVSHFFASLAVRNVTKSLEGLIRSPSARKDLKKLKDETKLQAQLTLLWPYALYLILRKK